MDTKPTGMVALVQLGWCDHPTGVAQPAQKAVPEGCLVDRINKSALLGVSDPVLPVCFDSISGELTAVVTLADKGSTQARVRNKMRNNDLRLGYCHASVPLRSAS